jgi:hypothetical protein
LALFTCSVGAYTVGTIEATLSPFLDTMGIEVKMIAVAFLVMSLCSVVATPIFGFICDSKVSEERQEKEGYLGGKGIGGKVSPL